VADHGYTLFRHVSRVGGVAIEWAWANRASAIGHGMTEGWDIEHASDMGCELDPYTAQPPQPRFQPQSNQELVNIPAGEIHYVDRFAATAIS